MTVIAAVNGPAHTTAIRTPTARSAFPRLDDEAVWILLDNALDTAFRDGEWNMHAFHDR